MTQIEKLYQRSAVLLIRQMTCKNNKEKKILLEKRRSLSNQIRMATIWNKRHDNCI